MNATILTEYIMLDCRARNKIMTVKILKSAKIQKKNKRQKYDIHIFISSDTVETNKSYGNIGYRFS